MDKMHIIHNIWIIFILSLLVGILFGFCLSQIISTNSGSVGIGTAVQTRGLSPDSKVIVEENEYGILIHIIYVGEDKIEDE